MTFDLPELVSRPAPEAARGLLGWTLLVDGVGGVLVETEAYDSDDPASHSFRGRTGRNAVMFGPAGTLYVYRSYGVHWCANVVCGEDGEGAAVLLRALEPTSGLDRIRLRRGVEEVTLLCSGPGRLTQALGISGVHDGADLLGPDFRLLPPAVPPDVVASTRVGISRAVERPWRYSVKGSRFVSRPRPRG